MFGCRSNIEESYYYDQICGEYIVINKNSYDYENNPIDSFLDDYGSIYVLFERNSIVTITYVIDNNIYERQMSYDIGIYQDNGNYKENIIYVELRPTNFIFEPLSGIGIYKDNSLYFSMEYFNYYTNVILKKVDLD